MREVEKAMKVILGKKGMEKKPIEYPVFNGSSDEEAGWGSHICSPKVLHRTRCSSLVFRTDEQH